MKKLFVLNGDPQQLNDLRQRLGDTYDIVTCHSVVEVQRHLEQQAGGAVLPLAPAAPHLNGNGTANSSMREEVSTEIDTVLNQIVIGGAGEQQTPRTLAARVDLLEQKIIESTLSRNRHHRKDTAAELGISRVTLYNKMKKFGMLN